jgi:hypothetical protein
MLLEYRVEDWVGSRDGRSVYPTRHVSDDIDDVRNNS